MKFVYYSLFFVHYKLIQLGRAGKLWSACSASVSFPVIFTISIHFSIGELFGTDWLVKYNSNLFGTIFLLLLVLLNLVLFVNKSKYLKIEEEYRKNNIKAKWSYLIFSIYATWVILIFYLASR